MKNHRKPVKFNVAWSAVLAGGLALAAGRAGAQQLIAWPIGQPTPLRFLLPGQPVRPLPHPVPWPRPLPAPPSEASPVSLAA